MDKQHKRKTGETCLLYGSRLSQREKADQKQPKVAEYISNQFRQSFETILYKFDFPIISLSSDGPYQNVIEFKGSDSILKRTYRN